MVGGGVVLLLLMGWITLALAPSLFPIGQPGPRYTGGPEMLMAIYAVFALLFSFGAAGVWAGISQIRTGKRTRQLPVLLGLVALLGVVIAAMQWLK